MTPLTGRTVQIARYGGPKVLAVVDASLPPLAPGEARIRTIAAGINFTDLKIRAGVWPTRRSDPFPYTPGIESVGVIEAVGSAVVDWRPGQTVVTMMQGLGGVRAERPGGYAEFVTVDADALALIHDTVDPLAMAAIGLPGVTAHGGLARIGDDLSQYRILITGAAGNVGACAVGIARARGATVTALISHAGDTEKVLALGADTVIVSPRGAPASLEPASVDAVLETVGGEVFTGCVQALRPGGVLSMVGAAAGGDVTFDAWRLIDAVVLTGYSTESLDGPSLRRAVADLTSWLGDGLIRPPASQLWPLADVADAHARIERGDLPGRILLKP